MSRARIADVDDAFEWFVVIVAIMSAIISQYPQYSYFQSQRGREPSLLAAAVIVPPLVLTIVIWLVGRLASSGGTQVVAKVVAWFMVIGTTWANLTSYIHGLGWVLRVITPGTRLLDDLLIGTSQFGFFLVPPSLTYFFAVPKYRELYPDSAFLRSRLSSYWPSSSHPCRCLLSSSCQLSRSLIRSVRNSLFGARSTDLSRFETFWGVSRALLDLCPC